MLDVKKYKHDWYMGRRHPKNPNIVVRPYNMKLLIEYNEKALKWGSNILLHTADFDSKTVMVQCQCGKIRKATLYNIFQETNYTGLCSRHCNVARRSPELVNDINKQVNKYGVKILWNTRTYNKKTHKTTVDILCRCGNIRKRFTDSLRVKHFTGLCRKCESLNKSYIDRSIPALNRVWYNYIKNAKLRQFEFTINKEFFIKLSQQKCYWCGSGLSNTAITSNNSIFKYNGIDRIDSKVGYVETNCVPCCIQCNNSKTDYTVEEYLNWINRLYHNLKRKNLIVGR